MSIFDQKILGKYSQKFPRQRLTHFWSSEHTQNVSIFGEGLYVKSSVVTHGIWHTVCPTILNETSNGAWGSMMVFRSFIILLLGITLVIVFGENWKAIKLSTVQWLKINDLLIKILYSDFTAILWLYDFKLRSKQAHLAPEKRIVINFPRQK